MPLPENTVLQNMFDGKGQKSNKFPVSNVSCYKWSSRAKKKTQYKVSFLASTSNHLLETNVLKQIILDVCGIKRNSTSNGFVFSLKNVEKWSRFWVCLRLMSERADFLAASNCESVKNCAPNN